MDRVGRYQGKQGKRTICDMSQNDRLRWSILNGFAIFASSGGMSVKVRLLVGKLIWTYLSLKPWEVGESVRPFVSLFANPRGSFRGCVQAVCRSVHHSPNEVCKQTMRTKKDKRQQLHQLHSLCLGAERQRSPPRTKGNWGIPTDKVNPVAFQPLLLVTEARLDST